MNAKVKPQHDQPADDRPMTKAEKRAAVKAAKARVAAVRRRRQAFAMAFAAVAVVGIVVTAFVLANNDPGDGEETAGSPGSAAPPPGANTPAAFPPLPQGADPALGKKPTTSAGTGELTKLTVTPLIEGKGPATAAGQMLTVNYVGVSYRTGEEFDASWNRAQPFSFQVGAGSVIPGWDQGLIGVKVGSRVQLDIPANMAYGENPGGGRPGGPLRFIVDVLAAQ